MLIKLYTKLSVAFMRFVIRLIGNTLDLRIKGLENIKDNVIFAVWHGDNFIFTYKNPIKKLAILAGDGVKGDIFSGLVHDRVDKIIHVPFNSDNPKAAAYAAAKLLSALEEGYNSAIALDGPRGPYRKIKPGIFLISKKSGKKIIPVGIAVSRKFTVPFRWDKYFVPLPFSRVVFLMDFEAEDCNDEKSLLEAMENARKKAGRYL